MKHISMILHVDDARLLSAKNPLGESHPELEVGVGKGCVAAIFYYYFIFCQRVQK